MTIVTIDDTLASRLHAGRGKNGDFNALVADALAETVRRWEWEAAGSAEMQAMLDGPRHTLAESNARMRLKYDIPDLSHLTRGEREAEAERVIALRHGHGEPGLPHEVHEPACHSKRGVCLA